MIALFRKPEIMILLVIFKKIKNKIINLNFQFQNDSWIIKHYGSVYNKL